MGLLREHTLFDSDIREHAARVSPACSFCSSKGRFNNRDEIGSYCREYWIISNKGTALTVRKCA